MKENDRSLHHYRNLLIPTSQVLLLLTLLSLQGSSSAQKPGCYNRVRVVPQGRSIVMNGSDMIADTVGKGIDTEVAEKLLCDEGIQDIAIDIVGAMRDPETLPLNMQQGALAGIYPPDDYDKDGKTWMVQLDCHRASAVGKPNGYYEIAPGVVQPSRASCNHALAFELGDIALRIKGEPSCRLEKRGPKPDSISALKEEVCYRATAALELSRSQILNRDYRLIR